MKTYVLTLLTLTTVFLLVQVQSCNHSKEFNKIHKDITNINEVLANHKYFVEQLIIMGLSNKLISVQQPTNQAVVK